MNSFNYVIWDFDGTLFDTYPHIASILNNILKNRYNVNLNVDKILKWCKKSLKFCFEKLEYKFNIDVNELQDLFRKGYMVNLESQQLPYPGAKEILHFINKNGGKNFIITHRGSTSLFKLLKYYKIESLFEKIISHEDGFPNKPNPASFSYLIKEFKIPKEEVIAIGDREIDIQTALAINIKSCYFNPEGKRHQLADFNISNLMELKEILNL
ncbi:MAG: HAD-IA family hydrolase [Candidatus Hodarchaeota archaeon]